MHTAPGACLLYAPGAACFSNMVLEHILLKYSSRLLMVQDHKVLMVNMVLDHKSRPKGQKKKKKKKKKAKYNGC